MCYVFAIVIVLNFMRRATRPLLPFLLCQRLALPSRWSYKMKKNRRQSNPLFLLLLLHMGKKSKKKRWTRCKRSTLLRPRLTCLLPSAVA